MSNYIDNEVLSAAQYYADRFAAEFNRELEARGSQRRMASGLLVKGFERLARVYGWPKVRRICERSSLQPFFDDMNVDSLVEILRKPGKLDDVYNAVFGWEVPENELN